MGENKPAPSISAATWGILLLLSFLVRDCEGVVRDGERVEETRTAGIRPEIHCSRERSRAASKIIDDYLMPFVEEQKYQISSSCRFHADNDMFRDQENHKVHVDVNEWRCGFCQKRFREEKFIDLHFDNRHYNLLNNTEGRCLADLCGALHCNQVVESKKSKAKCNLGAASRNRHLCESLADSCFPVNQSPLESRLHEFFMRQFCDSHTCNGKHKPFAMGGRKQSNILYLIVCILLLLLLPLFYLLVFLSRREMRNGVQVLKRITKVKHKK
ncbi:uncharacterized protein LOC144704589 isoform X1 [Wolffia australiana]